MKGLLHRLATRAAGTAAPVRSDVRLPFGAGGWGEAVEAAGDAAGDAAAPSRYADAPAGADAPALDVPAPPVAAAPVPIGHAPVPATPWPAVRAAPPAFETRAPAGPRARAEAQREERLPPRLVDHLPEARVANDAAGRRSDGEATTESAANTAPPASPARGTFSAVAAASAHRTGHAEPARLMPAAALPPAPVAAVSAARWPAWAPHAPPSTAKSEEATEVHVHIGRIDVTALHEPSAPRRRPAAAPAPLSLDAYLARRGRT